MSLRVPVVWHQTWCCQRWNTHRAAEPTGSGKGYIVLLASMAGAIEVYMTSASLHHWQGANQSLSFEVNTAQTLAPRKFDVLEFLTDARVRAVVLPGNPIPSRQRKGQNTGNLDRFAVRDATPIPEYGVGRQRFSGVRRGTTKIFLSTAGTTKIFLSPAAADNRQQTKSETLRRFQSTAWDDKDLLEYGVGRQRFS